jgi:competence CoiA-like predicted nuclease
MAYNTFTTLKFYFENHTPIDIKLEVEQKTAAHIAATINLRQSYDGTDRDYIHRLTEQQRYAEWRYEVINTNVSKLCELLYNEENQVVLTEKEASEVFKKHLHIETEMLLAHLAINWLKESKFTLFQLMDANIFS